MLEPLGLRGHPRRRLSYWLWPGAPHSFHHMALRVLPEGRSAPYWQRNQGRRQIFNNIMGIQGWLMSYHPWLLRSLLHPPFVLIIFVLEFFPPQQSFLVQCWPHCFGEQVSHVGVKYTSCCLLSLALFSWNHVNKLSPLSQVTPVIISLSNTLFFWPVLPVPFYFTVPTQHKGKRSDVKFSPQMGKRFFILDLLFLVTWELVEALSIHLNEKKKGAFQASSDTWATKFQMITYKSHQHDPCHFTTYTNVSK